MLAVTQFEQKDAKLGSIAFHRRSFGRVIAKWVEAVAKFDCLIQPLNQERFQHHFLVFEFEIQRRKYAIDL